MWFNIWPALIAAIASMILGFVWYGPLFGKYWMKLQGLTKKDVDDWKKSGKSMGPYYFAAFVASFVTAFTLSMLFQALGVSSIGGAWAFGVIIWVGFVLTTTLSSVLWEGKSISLYSLNNLHTLVNILLIGAVMVYI